MIGADRYFPDRYFAPRYWPKHGATLVHVDAEADYIIEARADVTEVLCRADPVGSAQREVTTIQARPDVTVITAVTDDETVQG